MGRVTYTARAREDLLELWGYIARRSLAGADRSLERIETACNLIREHPRLGPARPDLAEEARVLVVQRWLVLYRLTIGGVQVVRVVDAARDLGELNWPHE